ncbi:MULTISPECIES: pyrroline-5-carboxylate reductase [Megasphaera]|uniref:Pyrroline-5-carboxylate reductase n=1 Tax=Megasphaera hutchinsoni TaxID=1588748 RepID=A0A134CD58_9FIRM|nr:MULTISPECIES: pyrroline-5-carboxylate reductase [Megasphaera]EGS31968.1 pyrroline-5-carboxylate reductase [Megasphaera sp. UPII 135-E]KXB90152.1 pyrroline-5-carboxylate reductase [Megasphaera hutchinsoni]
MFKTIGICGAGNMGKAIIKGLVQSKAIAPENIFVYDIHTDHTQLLADQLGIQAVNTPAQLASHVQALIMAVKPPIIPHVMTALRKAVLVDTVIISIAAGVTLAQLMKGFEEKTKIIRVMPNTPAMVGEGMAALAINQYITAEEQDNALAIFRSFGKAEIVKEELIDAVCGVSGSGPAYVYMFIEALADGAVHEGMSRNLAYTFAAQTVFGAAKMVLETGMHPGVLKDQVCSPGGTTIAAVKSLETNGFRSAAMEAVIVASEKNKTL